MGIYDDWTRDIEKKLSVYNKEDIIKKIPSIIKLCPSCHHLSLKYNIESGEIKCGNCGFKTIIPLLN